MRIGQALGAAMRIGIAALVLAAGSAARADDKLVVLTTWFAQAEHGGLYQAAATGIYKKYGLDVTVKSGGPQVNGVQLLLAGQADFIMNYDFAVLQGVERGLPLVTICAPFQFDLQGVMTHEDVKSLAGLKDKTILVAGTGTTYWWPWLKAKYGYTDAQMRPYTFNLAAVLRRPEHRAAGVRLERAVPGPAEGREGELLPARRRRLSALHAGDDDDAEDRAPSGPRWWRASSRRRSRAGRASWKNPAPAIEEIKKANPNMTDGQIAYGIQKMREMKVVSGGDAAKLGIGTMTDERWKKTFDFMVAAGLLEADHRLQEGLHAAVREGPADHALTGLSKRFHNAAGASTRRRGDAESRRQPVKREMDMSALGAAEGLHERSRPVVLHADRVEKTYPNGTHALAAVEHEASGAASSSRCSGPRAAARARC